MNWKRLAPLALVLITTIVSAETSKQKTEPKIDLKEPLTINWYHGAEYFQPIIDAFTEATGIPVKVTSDYDIFTTDVIMVSDYKGLLEAKHFLHFRKYDDDFWQRMSEHVPEYWRDEGGTWLGYAVRIRTAITNRKNVAVSARPKSYLDLADPIWRGRMTQRGGHNVYNRSTVAYIIAQYGEDVARDWAKGVVANIADGEYLNDVEGAIAVGRGDYDIGFSNTYYLGYMQDWYDDEPDVLALTSKAIDVVWLEGEQGVFANLTGVAISSWIEGGTAKHKAAQKLVEFLLSRKGQSLMSQHVFKYPVRDDVKPSEYLQGLGPVKIHKFDINSLRYHYDAADRILREAGWKKAW